MKLKSAARRGRHEPGTVQYYCLGGTLRVRRNSYCRVGVHNGATVVPLELIARVAEGATPTLAYNVIHGYAHRDMRQHAEAPMAAHRDWAELCEPIAAIGSLFDARQIPRELRLFRKKRHRRQHPESCECSANHKKALK